MEQLKPCPFCGGEPLLKRCGKMSFVVCDYSYCDVQPWTKYMQTDEEAIEVWNRRAE